MNTLRTLFDVLATKVLNVYGMAASIVVYDWDGSMPLSQRIAFTSMVDGAMRSVGSGSALGPYGWVDMMNVGNPRVQFDMTVSGTYREVKFQIDYGELHNGQMIVNATHIETSAGALPYTNHRSSYTVSMDKSVGRWARIRSITNNGDGTVVLDARAPSTMRPFTPANGTVLTGVEEV